MVFSTSSFLFAFFPAAFLGYYLCPVRFRNFFLLLASLLFYGWDGGDRIRILAAVIAISYLSGLLISKTQRVPSVIRKTLLAAAVLADLAILGYCKYFNFLAESIAALTGRSFAVREIALPAGISFFIFQAISYVVDVYRGEAALADPVDLGMYLSFFPQLIAGPIVRYGQIRDCLKERKSMIRAIAAGFERFIAGLCKKVLLANRLALIADILFEHQDQYGRSVMLTWLCVIAFALQIYYDFSGYSDMALGMAQIFGFEFPENFDHPYCAVSITDFWRRWHISLSSWFRDYVYIPLGGSRKGAARHIFNLFVVWALSGLWHGAAWHYVVWGLFYFVLLTAEKYLIKPERFQGRLSGLLYRVFTLIMVLLAWVIFRASSIREAVSFLADMFGLGELPLMTKAVPFLLRDDLVLFIAAAASVFPLRGMAVRSGRQWAEGVYAVILTAAFILAVSYLLIEAYNPFLYFQF